MAQMNWNEQSEKALAILSKGAFLTTAYGGKVNTMTISWGSIGFIWGRPIFTVAVRPSRHTYALIEQSNEFTVSIPLADMQQALALCGAKSGRDTDKFAAAGLATLPGRKVVTPVIAGDFLQYECKVVVKQALFPAAFSAEIASACYGSGDYHTVYFGEIVAAYSSDSK
ncbi:MAG: flavin reductase family protein [Negativicutes bacterium]|nr:flavin reductase family protein [Negativicutes bacterium]